MTRVVTRKLIGICTIPFELLTPYAAPHTMVYHLRLEYNRFVMAHDYDTCTPPLPPPPPPPPQPLLFISQGTGLRVEGWLILGRDTLSFSTRDSSRVERKPEVQIFLRAPDTTFVVAATVNRKQLPFPFTSPSRLTNTFMLEQHSSTGATYYVFVALDSESKHQWVRCLEEVIAGERQTALSTKRELKAVTVVPLKTSTTCNSLNMSVTSSMMDDDDSMV